MSSELIIGILALIVLTIAIGVSVWSIISTKRSNKETMKQTQKLHEEKMEHENCLLKKQLDKINTNRMFNKIDQNKKELQTEFKNKNFNSAKSVYDYLKREK